MSSCPSVTLSFSQTARHRKTSVNTKDVPFGETIPGKILILLLNVWVWVQVNCFLHYFLHEKSIGIMMTMRYVTYIRTHGNEMCLHWIMAWCIFLFSFKTVELCVTIVTKSALQFYCIYVKFQSQLGRCSAKIHFSFSVGIKTATSWTVGVQFSAGNRDFSAQRPDGLWSIPSLLSNGVPGTRSPGARNSPLTMN
jgi:hypothetical protein